MAETIEYKGWRIAETPDGEFVVSKKTGSCPGWFKSVKDAKEAIDFWEKPYYDYDEEPKGEGK